MNDYHAGRRDIVAIGASAGGIRVLLELAASLPAAFSASVLIVQHIGAHPSRLPELLTRAGPNPASHAVHGMQLEHGRLYVAPPDCHVIVHRGHIRLWHGAKENHARPAIDPLFRSAAIAYGPRVIGVVLTGRLDDGTAGLQAIKVCGGETVVQDPEEAEERSMPSSAMANVAIDHVTTRSGLGALLAALVARPLTGMGSPKVPEDLLREHQLSISEGNSMEHLDAIATPSKITCPDCHGVLFELRDKHPHRYRCHTGHAYTARTLASTQAMRTEEAIFSAMRALHEREALLRAMSERCRAVGEVVEAERYAQEAKHVALHAKHLYGILNSAA
jgi:two-component system, chemotaxis family, protein-glutamate methylesterase/glutaminase